MSGIETSAHPTGFVRKAHSEIVATDGASLVHDDPTNPVASTAITPRRRSDVQLRPIQGQSFMRCTEIPSHDRSRQLSERSASFQVDQHCVWHRRNRVLTERADEGSAQR